MAESTNNHHAQEAPRSTNLAEQQNHYLHQRQQQKQHHHPMAQHPSSQPLQRTQRRRRLKRKWRKYAVDALLLFVLVLVAPPLYYIHFPPQDHNDAYNYQWMNERLFEDEPRSSSSRGGGGMHMHPQRRMSGGSIGRLPPPPGHLETGPVHLNFVTKFHNGMPVGGEKEVFPSYRFQGTTAQDTEEVSFFETFWNAKQAAIEGTPAGPGGMVIAPNEQPSREKYVQRCLLDYTDIADHDASLETSYQQMDSFQQASAAERFWQNQHGKVWMQHSRKAGGTTLCMLLRLNSFGLIKTRHLHWRMPQRETCQINKFCADCDLLSKAVVAETIHNAPQSIPRLVDCVMNVNQRNFIEFEGAYYI